MAHTVLIGCRGWNHDEWTPALYPEELPVEWRFCFYSNEIRSVLVPYSIALQGDAAQWREECDEEFRFVFEFPVAEATGDAADALRRLLERMQPVADRTAAVLIQLSPARDCSPQQLERLCQVPGSLPVCLDVPDSVDPGATAEVLHRRGVTRVWHAPASPPPKPQDGFQIALIDHADLPALRRILERLHAHPSAALYCTDPLTAVDLVRQVHTLAELMGV